MKGKKLIASLLIGALIMSTVGCGGSTTGKDDEKKYGGTIVVPLASDPHIINGAFTNVREAQMVTNMVFSPIYTYRKGNIKNYLAEDIKFEDSKTLTIKLRKDLKWHDEKPITADDLMFTINTVLDEKQNSPSRQYLIVDGTAVTVEKVDDLTVKILLPKSSPSFIYNMSKIYPIPKHIFEGEEMVAKSQKNNTPVGSGPFKFKEWKKGESIVLERYDNYFGGKPKADMIALKIIPNEASQEAALNKGEITIMKASLEAFEKSKSNDKLQTYTYSEDRLNYIVFNQNKEYMKNADFRKAISYALDRKEMIKSAYGEEGSKQAKSLLVPDADFYVEDVEGYDYDIKEAKKLLQESAVTVTKLKLGYNTGRFAHKNYALVTQQQLKELGIEVEIIPYESKAFFNTLFSKSTDCDMYVNGYAWGLEPNPYRGMFETGTFHNQTSYSNKEVDDLWNKGFVEGDKEERKEIYKEIQHLVAEDAPIYTIDYEQNLMVAQKNLKGIEEAKPISVLLFQDWDKLYIE